MSVNIYMMSFQTTHLFLFFLSVQQKKQDSKENVKAAFFLNLINNGH